ncbi:MAG: hypothetical protein IJ305_02330 [Oscillospiraceae bacterium]|nr:hypothetical protein [Oscillospiraceae bacterium]MBR1531990.1 hypothetical protein [Eubacterium sp.]
MEKKILRFDSSDIFIMGTGRIDDTKPINLAESVAPTEYGYPVNTVPSNITFSIKDKKTVYDVSADFSLEGKETLLNQFKKLILSIKSA